MAASLSWIRSGAPNALPQWVAAQAKFKPFTSEQQVLDAYRQIDATVKAKLPAYFSKVPKSAMEIQPEPELSRATASGAQPRTLPGVAVPTAA